MLEIWCQIHLKLISHLQDAQDIVPGLGLSQERKGFLVPGLSLTQDLVPSYGRPCAGLHMDLCLPVGTVKTFQVGNYGLE